MAWFALYCSVLIQTREKPPVGECYAHLCHFENSKWVGQYLVGVRRMVSYKESYSLFCCFPHIPGTGYGDEFQNTGDNQTSLGLGTFKWLISIRPSQLVYRSGYDYYSSHICPDASPDSSVTIKCTLEIQTLSLDTQGV